MLRSAAKFARDNRQITNQPPLRKERAELEALQATVEKMKLDHEGVLRKARMAEKRLLLLTKDQATRCDELEAQVRWGEPVRGGESVRWGESVKGGESVRGVKTLAQKRINIYLIFPTQTITHPCIYSTLPVRQSNNPTLPYSDPTLPTLNPTLPYSESHLTILWITLPCAASV